VVVGGVDVFDVIARRAVMPVRAIVGAAATPPDCDARLTNNLTNNGVDKCGLRRVSVECLPW
jgi:hypothetical protein